MITGQGQRVLSVFHVKISYVMQTIIEVTAVDEERALKAAEAHFDLDAALADEFEPDHNRGAMFEIIPETPEAA